MNEKVSVDDDLMAWPDVSHETYYKLTALDVTNSTAFENNRADTARKSKVIKYIKNKINRTSKKVIPLNLKDIISSYEIDSTTEITEHESFETLSDASYFSFDKTYPRFTQSAQDLQQPQSKSHLKLNFRFPSASRQIKIRRSSMTILELWFQEKERRYENLLKQSL